MSRCEHGQKITKFCVADHCHHKEAAGCDYCIKKYHCHLTNTILLGEADLEGIVKTLTFPSDCKYKSRALQDLVGDYLRQVKQAFSSWLDSAQNIVNEKLSHPLLRRQGLLNTYQKIRNRDYKKITAKDLKAIHQFSKNTQPEAFKKQQLQIYFEEIEWAGSIIEAASSLSLQLAKLPLFKELEMVPIVKSPKLGETYESIVQERERQQLQEGEKSRQVGEVRTQTSKLEEITKASSLMKNRIGKQSSQKQKSSTPSKEGLPKDIIADLFGKKLLDNTGRASIMQGVSEARPEEKFGNETTEEKAKRLRRRRSSIDEGMDMKFGQGEKEKEAMELKKKYILENVFSSKDSEKEKRENEAKQTDPSLAGKQSVREERNHQLQKDYTSILKTVSTPGDKAYSQENKSEASSKASEQNIFEAILNKGGFNVAELLNSLIPAPPSVPRTEHEHEVVTNKIVKVPLPNNGQKYLDEIQSPIFKNKRKMDKQSTVGFGIALNPVESKDPVLSMVNEELKEETEKEIPNFNPTKEEQQESSLIILEMNEKNSLLLFCEALKSESERAIELLKAALKYSPNNLSAAEYLSYLYLDTEKAKECLEVCESILLKLEDKAEEFEVTLHLHNNRAAALNKLGRYSESIVVLEKCLKYRRKHYFYKNLADAYFSLGIPEKAAMNYEKAIRLDPGYDEAFYNLAVTQFIQEEYTSAKLNIDQAIKIDCTNEAYLELEKNLALRIENTVR